MYDENSMKSHIFWIKFKRVFLLIFLTIIGTSLGVVISDYIVNILLFPSFLRIIIVVVSAVLFLAFALLMTANTGKEIQDSYWKIAVYKKLAIISKKLDNLDPSETTKHVKKDSTHTNSQKESKESQVTSGEPELGTVSDDEKIEINSEINDLEKDLKDLAETLNEK